MIHLWEYVSGVLLSDLGSVTMRRASRRRGKGEVATTRVRVRQKSDRIWMTWREFKLSSLKGGLGVS
jgi:hypothetical protein